MSTVFEKEMKREDEKRTAGGIFKARREERCSLCRGELYPGDPYFELEGRAVCEDCLGRYARQYFSAQLRRVSGGTKGFDTV